MCVFLSFHSTLEAIFGGRKSCFLFRFTDFECDLRLLFFVFLHERDTSVSHHSSSPVLQLSILYFFNPFPSQSTAHGIFPKWDEMRGKLFKDA